MADSFGNVSLPGAPLLPGITVTAPLPVIELAQQPPAALLLAATLAAVVVGRGGNGALLLRTDYGTLALKTPLSLPAGSQVNLKLLPGPPPSVVLLHVDSSGTSGETPALPPAVTTSLASAAKAPGATVSGAAAESTETAPAQLALGNAVEATVTAPAANGGAALAAGTRLMLRVTVADLPTAPPADADGEMAPATLGSAAPTADREAPPASFSGTVLAGSADAAGQTLLDTPLGTLALDRRLALPPGATVELSDVTALPRTPAEALGAATVVPARLVALPPGGAMPALPLGSRLELRVQALAGTAPDDVDLAGTVVASTAGETVVETPIGTLALERRLALPPGSLVSLQQLAATPPDEPSDLPLAQRTTWPALEETLATLERALPDLAAQLRTTLAPASGEELAGTLLFLMSALNAGTWPGPRILDALDAFGRRDLRLKLDSDVSELRQLDSSQSGDWHVYALPLIDGAAVRPVRLYFRRRSAGSPASDQGTRFVLEVEMSRMGALQLDGLVRPQRFDLVLRSHRPIAAELRQEIAEVFHGAVAAAGLGGDITFATASRFAVAPLESLAAHIGVNA
ncbi:MAG TPA: hypothetical protein VMA53_25420 [Stellaceae bacterium]|nr:hypothetical protein [Stellaceae bacterium]